MKNNAETKVKFSLKEFAENQEKRELSGIYKDMQEEALSTFKAMGFNCTDANLIDKRGLIADAIYKVDGQLQYQSNDFKDLNFKSTILQNCEAFNNMVSNLSIPLIDDTNPQWLDETATLSTETPNVGSVKFFPKRLSTKLNVSKMVTKQRVTDYDVISNINSNLENKLIKSIFTYNHTQYEPEGIFNNTNLAGGYTDLDDIVELAYNVQKNGAIGCYIISPKAKAMILEEDKTAFNTDKFLGENYIINPLMEDGIIAYVDLSKLAVCSWQFVDLTIDNITLSTSGQDIYYLTGYYDFKLYKDCFCSWLNMSPTSQSGNGN